MRIQICKWGDGRDLISVELGGDAIYPKITALVDEPVSFVVKSFEGGDIPATTLVKIDDLEALAMSQAVSS